MTGLMLPPHVAAQRREEKIAARAEAAAGAIKGSSTNGLSSDDFVSAKQVYEQLEELREYIEGRREFDEDYTLPAPVGWRVGLLMMTIPEMTDGGLVMVDDAREARSIASPQGVVLSMGPSAYKDPSRFAMEGKLEPWVKLGDRIVFKKYDVTMFQLANGQRIAFMNDTQAIGVLDSGWTVPA